MSPNSFAISLLGSDISPVQAQCAAPSPPSSFTLPELHPTQCFSSPSFFPLKPEGIFRIHFQLPTLLLLSSQKLANIFDWLASTSVYIFPPSPLGGAPCLLLLFPCSAFSSALRQNQHLSYKVSHCQKISLPQLFISFLQLIADTSGSTPALHPSSTLQNSSAIVEDLLFRPF